MTHRPVCTKCEVEFTPTCNEAKVLDYSDNGMYTIWFADEWTCPECDFKIIVGFGDGPVMRHYEEMFKRFVAKAEDNGWLRKNYGDIQTKAKNEVTA